MVCFPYCFPARSEKVHRNVHLPQLFQGVMKPRLHRAQRAIENRRDLVQRRSREKTEFHHEAMLFRQACHRGRIRKESSDASAERSGASATHGTWSRASGAESPAQPRRRLPFRKRCRRMPYSQVENRQRPSKRSNDRHASRSVSCANPRPSGRRCRGPAQRHRPAACNSASRWKAFASPARARSISSRWSFSAVFNVPMIPPLPPKGSLEHIFFVHSRQNPA